MGTPVLFVAKNLLPVKKVSGAALVAYHDAVYNERLKYRYKITSPLSFLVLPLPLGELAACGRRLAAVSDSMSKCCLISVVRYNTFDR
jgi:hypothetical protein